MKKVMSTFLVVVCFAFNSSYASEKNEALTLAFIGNLPPYSYEENGVVKGVDITIMKEIFSRLKIDISLELNPWARLILRAEEGTINAIGATFCHGRDPWDAFLVRTDPIYMSNISIFSRNTSDQKRLSSLKELAGKNVGQVRDYFYREEFEKADYFDVYGYKNDELLLRSLQMGRIDHAIAEELPFRYFCSKDNSCGLIKKAFTFLDNPICLAIPTRSRGGDVSQMIDDINRVIAELQADGFIDDVLSDLKF